MGILLTLLGGVQKGGQKAGSVPLRGDVHMLVVGDPGLGKSQLLQVQFCNAVNPDDLHPRCLFRAPNIT